MIDGFVILAQAVLIGVAVPVVAIGMWDLLMCGLDHLHSAAHGQRGDVIAAKSIEDIAAENDMPLWIAAESMVRLMKRGLVAPPTGTTPDAHIDWLERTYPRPQSTVGRKRNRKE